MKKKKSLSLSLNKRKISELSKASQQRLLGGASYATGSTCGCGGGGGGTLSNGSRPGVAGCCS